MNGSSTSTDAPFFWRSDVVKSHAQMVRPTESLGMPTLKPDTDYSWRVRTELSTSTDGTPEWSLPLPFSTAPAVDSFSTAGSSWIGGQNQLRADLVLPPGVPARGRAYVSGLGSFYFHVNGQSASDHVLDPPQTVYPARVNYVAFDILKFLKPGHNAIGAVLGNYKWGYTDQWCNMTRAGGPDGCRALLVQLVVVMADGTKISNGSSPSTWQVRQGPIIWDHFFHGETYDSRFELDEWDVHPLANWGPDAGWVPASAMINSSHTIPGSAIPGRAIGLLSPASTPPIRVTESFPVARLYKASRSGEEGENCAPAKLAAIADECRDGGPMPPVRCDGTARTAITLQCRPGSGTIDRIDFAAFGQVTGGCGVGFSIAGCHANGTAAIVTKLCVGKTTCSIDASVASAGGGTDPCPGKVKKLAVVATGCDAATPHVPPPPPGPPPPPTRWVFDFGQNVVGFVTLQLDAGHGIPAGTDIRIEHGEIAYADTGDTYDTYCHAGSDDLRHEPCRPHQTRGFGHETRYAYIGDFNDANQTNVYIVRGPGAIEYTPLFATAGFRFVTVSGLPPSFSPSRTMLTSRFVHTDVDPVGDLRLPSVVADGGTPDILNRIHHMVRYSQMSNLYSIPTDCPQRERRGWMGDAQVSSGEATLNFDMEGYLPPTIDCYCFMFMLSLFTPYPFFLLSFFFRFYNKFLSDIRDDQVLGRGERLSSAGPLATTDHGSVADVVPFDGIGGWPGDPVWQVAYFIIVREHWKQYGDPDTVCTHYQGLLDLMGWFQRNADPSTGLLLRPKYGDWVCVDAHGPCPRTPPQAVTSFYFVKALGILAELASVAGRPMEEEAKWAKEHAAAVRSWHTHFYNSSVGGYAPMPGEPRGSQTTNAMALALGAPPDATTRSTVGHALVENTETINHNHTTFGIVGSVWVHSMLAEVGRSDVALSTLLTDAYPGFGHMVANNMTTLCENWLCTFYVAYGSQNHIMYGGFDAWMIEALGGIQAISNATSTAWENFVVSPDQAAVTRLGSGGFSIRTRFGLSSVDWRWDSATQKCAINVTVPIGSTASVEPPLTLAAIRPGGAPLQLAEITEVESGIAWAASKAKSPAAAVIGSGSYRFTAAYSSL